MTKSGPSAATNKSAFSGAERQRRYRLKKGGLVSIDIEPQVAETLRHLRAQIGGKNSTVIAAALGHLSTKVRPVGRKRAQKTAGGKVGAKTTAGLSGAGVIIGTISSPGDDSKSGDADGTVASRATSGKPTRSKRLAKQPSQKQDSKQTSFGF